MITNISQGWVKVWYGLCLFAGRCQTGQYKDPISCQEYTINMRFDIQTRHEDEHEVA